MAWIRILSVGVLVNAGAADLQQCVGTVPVAGGAHYSLIATKKNMPWKPAGPVQNEGGTVAPEMWGRAYLAEQCIEGAYSNTDYAAIRLLGKRLVYTVDVSQAGCGCNAALYLVSMKQNPEASGCDDFYCDANSVCGIRCDEIDIQEANKFAFHSALHRQDDGGGVAAGLGGWVLDNRFAMTPDEYGPGGRCIDTNHPFQVSAGFPTNHQGRLLGLDMKLSQHGKPCEVSYRMDRYEKDPNFEQLSQSLAAGMVVAISYWEADDMLWLDGPGLGGGLCHRDDKQCGTAPKFSNFAIQDLGGAVFYP